MEYLEITDSFSSYLHRACTFDNNENSSSGLGVSGSKKHLNRVTSRDRRDVRSKIALSTLVAQ